MTKRGLLRALLSKRSSKSRMKKETASQKRYAKHYKKAGSRALTYAQWMDKGEKQNYFKGTGFRVGSVEARLREEGIDPKRFKKK